MTNTQSSTDLLQPPSSQQDLPYSGRDNYIPETKSMREINYQSTEQSIEQLREKWKSGGFRSPAIENKR